jgi:hypothetical protein
MGGGVEVIGAEGEEGAHSGVIAATVAIDGSFVETEVDEAIEGVDSPMVGRAVDLAAVLL